MIDLRLGDWRTALDDVGDVDSVITDPPFSPRTHGGQRHGRKDERYGVKNASRLSHRGIGYGAWSEDEAREYVAHWTRRTRQWICTFTSHDFIPVLESQFATAGWTTFAPIACVQLYRNVRLAGDGPSNWTDHFVVARPRRLRRWRALPGAYVGKSFDTGENALDRSERIVAGAKPLWLMREIVRDYSNAGDIIVDPFAGGFSTGVVVGELGDRDCFGAEIDPSTHAKADRRVRPFLHPAARGAA